MVAYMALTTKRVVFATLALLLAAAGIYGVISHSVTLRTHELGIRAALGASRLELMKTAIGQSMVWALAGVAIGMAASMGLARLIESILFEVRLVDGVSLTAESGLLTAVAADHAWDGR